MAIDFSLTPELEAIRMRIRTFVDEVIKPEEAKLEGKDGGEPLGTRKHLAGWWREQQRRCWRRRKQPGWAQESHEPKGDCRKTLWLDAAAHPFERQRHLD